MSRTRGKREAVRNDGWQHGGDPFEEETKRPKKKLSGGKKGGNGKKTALIVLGCIALLAAAAAGRQAERQKQRHQQKHQSIFHRILLLLSFRGPPREAGPSPSKNFTGNEKAFDGARDGETAPCPRYPSPIVPGPSQSNPGTFRRRRLFLENGGATA